MSNKRKVFEYVLSMGTKGGNTWTKAQKGIAAFNKEVKNGNDILRSAQGQMLGFLGAYAGFAGTSQMIQGVLAGQKAVQNMANTAGIGVQEFQALAYATSMVGIEQDKLADISKDVREKIGDFIATGGGEMADFFENVAPKVGITAAELQNLSGPDVLLAVKKALDDANVSAEEQIFYLEGMASDASLLIPLLQDEGKLLKEKAAAGRELGVAISEMDQEELIKVNAAIKEMQASLEVLQRDIVVALAPAIKDFSQAITENREDITAFAVGIADSARAVVQFVLDHQTLIEYLAKTAVGVLVLTKVLGTLTTVYRGVNAASLAMTGTQVLPWLKGLTGGASASTIAVKGLSMAMKASLVGAAVMGIAKIGELIKVLWDWRKASGQLREREEQLAATQARLQEKYKEISAAVGILITSDQELNRLRKEGIIRMNEAGTAWVKSTAVQLAAHKKLATETAKVQKAGVSIEKDVAQQRAAAYQKYADEVTAAQKKIIEGEKAVAGAKGAVKEKEDEMDALYAQIYNDYDKSKRSEYEKDNKGGTDKIIKQADGSYTNIKSNALLDSKAVGKKLQTLQAQDAPSSSGQNKKLSDMPVETVHEIKIGGISLYTDDAENAERLVDQLEILGART